MRIVEFGRLSQGQRAQLEGDEDDPFDTSQITLSHRPKDQHVALADEAGRLVASTGMVTTQVSVDGRRLAVVGLGGVIVSREHRGRGLAREVVGAALARAATLGPQIVILFCLEDRTGLYRKLGFSAVEAEVLVRQPSGYVATPLRTMWRGLRDGAVWPEGTPVVVESLPF